MAAGAIFHMLRYTYAAVFSPLRARRYADDYFFAAYMPLRFRHTMLFSAIRNG